MEIVVRNLCKSFGDQAVLRDLSFTAGPGITAVMAPSGSGKTTLLRILLGLERPDSGTVEGLTGRRISAVFQEDRLLEHLSAEGNLRFVLGRVYDPAAARALLDRLGLPDTGAQPVREFSGGMKRRLALARALLHDSQIYIFDEATSNIDAESENDIMEVLRDLAKRKNVILISHRLANVAPSEKIYVMEAGRVIEQGRHEELLKNGGHYARMWNVQLDLENYDGKGSVA